MLDMRFPEILEWRSLRCQERIRLRGRVIVVHRVIFRANRELCEEAECALHRLPLVVECLSWQSFERCVMVCKVSIRPFLLAEVGRRASGRRSALRDRQRSYTDKRRKPLEFQVGDKVMLKVSPWKAVIRFGKRGKLNPRYIGPFKILAKIGTVAYRLELLEKLSLVHSTFHVLNLKKCLSNEPLAIPLDEIHVDDKLNFIEEPIEIMDSEVKSLKQIRILIMKVRCKSRRCPEYTWEREDQMQKKYPHLFANLESASQATS
ncbi:hypothetical protein Tco_1143738 [Tanacetum coccineum]